MSLNKKSVDDINVKGLRVLCRCDFNVPLKDGKITDENRLVAALPTIKKLIADGGKVILCSHLGKVKTEEDKKTKTLAPVAVRLSELLGQEVKFVADPEVVGPNARAAVEAMKDGEVFLLENTRFRPEETKNGEAFSKDLASICDVFVNDAFGTAHRAHASNVGISANVEKAVAGFLLENEIAYIQEAVENPERPFVAILGGSKVSDKIGVIENLLEKADKVLIGGGMTYTFFKAQGIEIGNSLVEEDKLDVAKALLEKSNGKLILPVDSKEANAFADYTEVKYTEGEAVDPGFLGLDIGPKSIAKFDEALTGAKTVVWNGHLDVYENPDFQAGTIGVMDAIEKQPGVKSIFGVGDSAAAAINLGYADKFSWISTGGGASMELLEGKELPGLAALTEK